MASRLRAGPGVFCDDILQRMVFRRQLCIYALELVALGLQTVRWIELGRERVPDANTPAQTCCALVLFARGQY